MIITTPEIAENQGRIAKCPTGGFVSKRMLLESDGMGYTITHTTIKAGLRQMWHYKNHLESCYCIKGYAHLKDLETGTKHIITPGVMYVLDKHDKHEFYADIETELICVFNPPLKGKELHQQDGSYAS
jgi:L-ectoine synthase